MVGAGVPLALNTIGHDRSPFAQATEATAGTDAAVAQARLDSIFQAKQDGGASTTTQGDAPLLTVLNQVRQTGDGLLILTSDGHTLTDEGMPAGNWMQLAAEADMQSGSANQRSQQVPAVTETTGSRVVAAIAVYQRGAGPLVGTVLLARSAEPLNRDIVELWVILGTIGVVAMLGATLLAFALARWVSRPLASLDSAAGRLADGDLAIRAVVGSGPPELRRLPTTFNTMTRPPPAPLPRTRPLIASAHHH